ncbi:TatD family hydrolase [Alistipes sp. OttesenSCG-928-B03]|nr:TatD family hydrolase [Alistipes sp. OttesenSCG-928-B03]
MNLIDTHSHLYDEAFDEDRDDALARAADEGVDAMLLPAVDSESHDALFDLCRRHPARCLPMMGLHPTSVNDNPRFREELDAVERYLAQPPEGIAKFYGVGEIGIDLYWSGEYYPQQREAFEAQVEMALKYGLPIAVHTRSAWAEMGRVLEQYRGRGLRGVMHAYSGDYADYERVSKCGDFMLGIGGVVTYKKSDLPELLAKIPTERIVLETDCPYLTPVPFRGKRNESAYLTYICKRVAEIYGMEPEQIADQTTRNARQMFGF